MIVPSWGTSPFSWLKMWVKPWSQDWFIAAGTSPGFCSMKLLEVFLLRLDGMLIHCRSLPCNLSGFPNNLLVPIYTPGWREALWEWSVLPKNTTQCPRPGLKPRPLAPESNTLTMRPPHLPSVRYIWNNSYLNCSCRSFFSFSWLKVPLFQAGGTTCIRLIQEIRWSFIQEIRCSRATYTLFQNGHYFSILLFTCKLAFVASFKGKYLLNFEFKNEATRANLQVNKRILKWWPFWNKVQ